MKKNVLCALALAFVAFMALPVSAEGAAEVRVGDVYSLGVCAKSGEELGSMGEPPVKVIEGREVRFCCAGCIKAFAADPTKAADVDAKMIVDQDAHYPTDKCVISGGKLNDSAVVFIAGNREFKTCCNDCAAKIKADPATSIKKLDAAVIEKQKAGYKPTTDLVTGAPLKADAIDLVVANRLIRVNDAASVKAFEANPHKYIAEADKASK